MPIDSPLKALGYGALWGWLPCGLVYSALTWAMTSGSSINGALVMLAFALLSHPQGKSRAFSQVFFPSALALS